MAEVEYLLGYGLLGDFGRFRAAGPLACRRGDRAVVRTPRGLEVGQVLREATPRHAAFLPNTTVGQLLRLVTPEDERSLTRAADRARQLFDRAAGLAGELGLPLEVIDAEVLLDGGHGVLHHLRWDGADVRPFVSTLSREFDLHVSLADLTRTPAPAHAAGEEPGCGSCGTGGGCGSCGTGGCGSCGTAGMEDTQAYFAELRRRMGRRTTLL